MDDDSSCSKLQLCLTWNSFTDNIISSLESSFGDGDFVDVTLACEGESIKAHKLVLSACSQYLRKLLKENPCPHPIIILKDVGLTELKDILVYMYHGEVRVEQDRITKLLKTAQILEVRGLQDINQKLDHDLDSGVQDACSSNEEVQIQESGDDESSNSVSFHSKSVTLTSEKDTSSARHSSLKPSAAKKHRPIPMLQCIQQSGKTDFSGPSALEVDRDENCGGGTESNSSSLAPDHGSFVEDGRIKQEIPDTEEFDHFVSKQSSNQTDNASDKGKQQDNNGYPHSPPPSITESPVQSSLAAQVLKRLVTHATSRTGNRTQDESTGDEVTVSLFKSQYKRRRSSPSNTILPDITSDIRYSDSLNFRSWGIPNLYHSQESTVELSAEKSNEIEILDVESLPLTKTNKFANEQQTMNIKHMEDTAEFRRPSDYMSNKGVMSLRYLDIENMLNINPQLRLQMLMCREYKKYTNILLVAMFGRDMLATHSLNGTGTTKPRLDAQKVNHIIEAVMAKFGVDQHHVKEAIRIKLNNEDKLRKRLSHKVTSTIIGIQ